MILWFYSLNELNFEALMAVYEEGNVANGAERFPEESAMMQKRLAEQDFEDYLRQAFFRQPGAAYCVYMENDSYITAARVEPFDNGYLISGLETRPDFRRKGYGRKLMENLISACKREGNLPLYSHVSQRNFASMQLHLQCGFRVFKDSARYLDGSVHSDSKTLIYE